MKIREKREKISEKKSGFFGSVREWMTGEGETDGTTEPGMSEWTVGRDTARIVSSPHLSLVLPSRVVSLPLGFFSLSPLVVTVRLTPFISRTDECNEWGAAEWVTRGRDGWEWDGNGKRPTAPHSSLRLSLRSFLGSHVTRLISSSSLHIETRE